MTRNSKLWRVAAALYVFINVGGAGLAAAQGEPMHAAGHVALLALGLGVYAIWRGGRTQPQPVAGAQLADERLAYLQQSVDAIAVELERIGEAQRFNEKLRAQQPAAQQGEASPLTKPKET